MKEKSELRVSVDRVLADEIRNAAAEMKIPVSALLRAQVLGFLQAREKSQKRGNPNFQVLAEFALGMRSAVSAMQALSLQTYPQLLELLTVARLPQPGLPKEAIDRMVRQLKILSEL